MTIDEATHYLGVKDGEDLRDVYAGHLFSFKTFFLNNKIIYSVFGQKIAKLEKIDEAFQVLGLMAPKKNIISPVASMVQEDMIGNFNDYQRFKSQFLHCIHISESIFEMKMYVQQLMDLHSTFISFWPKTKLEEQNIKLSEELDPVDFLKQLYEARTYGICTFAEFRDEIKEGKASDNRLPNLLLKESMRLYLLTKKEKEWKKHSQV
jgi:hypothetical protein